MAGYIQFDLQYQRAIHFLCRLAIHLEEGQVGSESHSLVSAHATTTGDPDIYTDVITSL